MEKLNRDDIKRIIDSPALSIEEIAKVIRDEMDIVIDTSLDREQIIDEVFKSYNTALLDVEANTQKADLLKEKKIAKKNKVPTISRKSVVLDCLQMGCYTQKEIIDEVNTRFGYDIKGTTANMRVGKVVRPLLRAGKIEQLADGVLRYVDKQ